ncbi:type IV secretion system protein [Gilliamella sp. BG7]|uniref:type IV secretion system protein n=1 Tax=unclassified Gilliamella TaxID=2685620 RepID=UPI0039869F78
MKITFFNDMGNDINSVVNESIELVQKGWVEGLLDVSSLGITIYVMFYGYMVLAGKIQDPMPDFVWNLARFAIVIGILSNMGTYVTYVNDAIHGIRGFLVGDANSENAYGGIDSKIANVVDLYVESWDKASGITGTLFWIVQALFMLPLCLGVVSYAIGIIVSEVSLIALLAVFPIFLFCYLWGWFKNMFSMWLQAVIGCCLFVLFLSVFSKVGFAIAQYTNDWVVKHSGAEVFVSCLMYMISGSITIAGVKLAGQISMALSQVSVDRMNQSMSSNIIENKINSYKQRKAQASQNQSLANSISNAMSKK